MEEKVFDFEFTQGEIETLKNSLRITGLEFNSNLYLYRRLCQAVCNEDDVKLINLYE